MMEIKTLDDLVEIVGKNMRHYHDFRRELAELKGYKQNGAKVCTCGCKDGANGVHASFCLFYDPSKYEASK